MDELGFDDVLRAAMRARLSSFGRAPADGDGLRPAAVAVTVVGDAEGRACFLLTRRASGMRRHPGQWALPGGRIEPDESPQDAALRELAEEVDLALEPGNLLGLLDDYPTRSGFRITPVVAWGPREPALRPDPGEVASVHLVPLSVLEDPAFPRLIPGEDPARPVIQLPLYGRFLHAPTAAVLYQFREVALHGRGTPVAHFDQPGFARR